MIFHSSQRGVPKVINEEKNNKSVVERVTIMKFLGVYLYEKLTCKTRLRSNSNKKYFSCCNF